MTNKDISVICICLCLFRSFKLPAIVNMTVVLRMLDVQNFVVVTDMQMSAHVRL